MPPQHSVLSVAAERRSPSLKPSSSSAHLNAEVAAIALFPAKHFPVRAEPEPDNHGWQARHSGLQGNVGAEGFAGALPELLD